ncbi:MAG: WYL domain-containing protein [Bacillota bacterium]|nr:WYL domain-containing protein [Bacillota bacterium]
MKMAVAPPKKMLGISILEILKKHSDIEHRLTQNQIQKLLYQEYELKAERKAIKRNLMELVDAGYPLECDTVVRVNKDGEDEEMHTNWYLERDISDVELRLLIDSVLFSRHIPEKQSRELIRKLGNLSSKYFRTNTENVSRAGDAQLINPQILYTREVLDEAISKGKKVCFHYSYFDVYKQVRMKTDEDGVPLQYVVNPIQMVATNGRFYLIGNYDKYDNISHYRLSRISEIVMLDEKAKPRREIKGLEHGLNLPKHMAEHIYMFSGESAEIIFTAKKNLTSEIIDWFGMDVSFINTKSDEMDVIVRCNIQAFRYWALQFGKYVTVKSPQSLVDTLKADVADMALRYGI